MNEKLAKPRPSAATAAPPPLRRGRQGRRELGPDRGLEVVRVVRPRGEARPDRRRPVDRPVRRRQVERLALLESLEVERQGERPVRQQPPRQAVPVLLRPVGGIEAQGEVGSALAEAAVDRLQERHVLPRQQPEARRHHRRRGALEEVDEERGPALEDRVLEDEIVRHVRGRPRLERPRGRLVGGREPAAPAGQEEGGGGGVAGQDLLAGAGGEAVAELRPEPAEGAEAPLAPGGLGEEEGRLAGGLGRLAPEGGFGASQDGHRHGREDPPERNARGARPPERAAPPRADGD